MAIPLGDAKIDDPDFIFRQKETSNLLLTCTNADGSPCDSSFSCNVTVAYPNNSLLFENQGASFNTDHYNITITNTDILGSYSYLIYCTNGTDHGAQPDLSYIVNLTGEDLNISKTMLYIFILIVTLVIFLLSLYGSIKIPWKYKRDEEGFIVQMNDLKYVKLLLWFMTYTILIFITWLTASVSKFLELGMASGFFDMIYLTLLVFIFPIFLIVFITGILKTFSDKKINDLLGRNLRVK